MVPDMTHDELLQELKLYGLHPTVTALIAVAELHKPIGTACGRCQVAPDDDHDYSSRAGYPCLTIQVIEGALL